MSDQPTTALSFAVMGAGGVGGYFGARLADAGAQVAFVARGPHLEAMRAAGLRIKSALGDAHIHPVEVSDDPRRIGPVDVILFAVKLYDTEAAAAAMAPMIGDNTIVLSLQNGVDGEETLARRLGAGHVMGGASYIFSAIEEPGVIRHTGRMARIVFGELDGQPSARAEALLAAFETAGIEAVLSPAIDLELWRKFTFLASIAALCGQMRQSLGPILATAETRRRLAAAMAEVAAVARAKGIALDEEVVEAHLAFADTLDGAMKPSLLQDLERGARTEIENLSGTVVRFGAELGIAVPNHAAAYAQLKKYAEGRPTIP
ncbi:MAG: 2-dehydropantoate 2-reductase [Rhodospirillales bacterium]|jgi:2-dehydropantoate 2-reductase|nr:2-dehydropantoate 2-reductase [Rhodospirillales bacterium]MDP6883899.1 2-dehydropantoate 2-reductase [Rhodospirillales bacterium]